MSPTYDALMLLSFGGPEGPDDVMPFLRNVTRGKDVPESRLLQVAEHYLQFGGVSPINEQNRLLIDELRAALDQRGNPIPILFANRNWHPLLEDTIRNAVDTGFGRILVLVTSAFSSYSGCRQYLEDLERAGSELGDANPIFDKIRPFYNSPGFISAMQDNLSKSIDSLGEARPADVKVLFTAHSIPMDMASNCEYETQLDEACNMVMEVFPEYSWQLVYQSRSGSPARPWLEPDINDVIGTFDENCIVACPIGFVSDHMEVLFDLDHEAKDLCHQAGKHFARVRSVVTHPLFVNGLVDLVEQRMGRLEAVPVLGTRGALPDECPLGCCLPKVKTVKE
ncbi:MAG: ferrochelatase [Planctomycetota bacterium]|nr:ferrochelatase [Planctomycetota bacterium]